MDWVLGNHLNTRTIVIGCAVAAVCTVVIARPKTLPLQFTFPHVSFSIGATAPAADAPSITISAADAAKADAIVSSVEDVHSQADLVAYADGLMQSDARIDQISISATAVSMTYETANRILNVRTVSDQTRATVMEDGTITVSGSWYRPLFTHVAQASSPNAGFSDIQLARDDSGLTPETEARLLARLSGRFRIGAIR